MKNRKAVSLLLAAAFSLSGCRAGSGKPEMTEPETTASDRTETTAETTVSSAPQTESTTTAPELKPYEFNPHVYSPMFASEIPQEHWESFYHLCDALRAGEKTFSCASQEAYEWATDSVVLGHLFPAACMKISGESNDGTTPFENGTGRIYYNMPAEEFAARQKEFEETVTDVLNSCLEPDDDDFEKCLKLYNYMESNYSYAYNTLKHNEGAHYYTLMNHTGICSELSGVYAYFLLQVGVDATELGCFAEDMCHAWTYVILDGQGYHIDPTWSLMSDPDSEKLSLEYFMMTDSHRINDGCPVDDLTVDLLPEYWANRSPLTFTATDDRFSTKDYSTLDRLDEKNKILYYTDMNGNSFELHYG